MICKDRRRIYKSPNYNGRQSSEYHIGLVNGRIAYIRTSDHWGRFSTSAYSAETNGRVYTWHTWELEGGRRRKDGEYAQTSQTGYI